MSNIVPLKAVARALQEPAAAIGTPPGSSWNASLQLQFRKRARGTRLMRCSSEGPLYVQRPFYPEGHELAHVYLLHPPGGLVSGDRLQLALQLESGAQVLCTTPGAGRCYRARHDRRLQEQHNRLVVAGAGSLEWFPQETIVFPGANALLDTRVELAPGARFCGWDILVLGLPANGIAFTEGSLRQRFRLDVAGTPLLLEQLAIDAAWPTLQNSAGGLQALPVNGLFVCGPFTATELAALDTAALHAANALMLPARCAGSLVDTLFIGRYLGTCAQQARRVFLAWWQLLRPVLLQRLPCAPAIWST